MDKHGFSIEELIAQGKLGRHETFTPRYGWLKKGFDAVIENSNIFREREAIEKLGVGKNMVNSIRFWCLAFKLIKVDDKEIVPTKLGQRLLGDVNGWDPYLEDDASLWLLHWQLFVPPFEAVSWPLAFNRCNLQSFDIKELSRIIFNAAQGFPSLAKASAKTYQRDASCIIRMYVDEEDKDSEIECPFTQLGLMYRTGEKNKVSFNTAAKLNLPPLIFAAACFSYAAHYLSHGQKNISLQRLVFGINSPGVAFKLPETAVGYYLSEASKSLDGFSLVNVLGNMQLHFNEHPEELYIKALNKFYLER
ncbi:MAG: DUF4007 family protein [Thermosipho sp. (in: Bacteria)]|nr:DUF4007 family protein [Thermosipho sp. (in: thermotogales)]